MTMMNDVIPTPARTVQTYVVSITPFAADGAIDEPAVRAHLRRMAAAGIGSYVGGGGSGEGFTLSAAEARALLEIASDELGGAVRAMGVEPRTAQQMVDFTREAAAAGVAACQIYSLDPGHGHRPTLPEIEAYFDTVLGACEVPAVVSTHQSVGYKVPVAMLAALAERHPQLVGVNCSHGGITYLAALVDALDPRIEICVGGPLQALDALGVGAHGFLCSEANLAPNLVAAFARAVAAGDLPGALDAFGTLARLHQLLYGNGGIRVTKAVLTRLGLPGGTLRPPQTTPADDVVDHVLARVRQLGLADLEGFPPA